MRAAVTSSVEKSSPGGIGAGACGAGRAGVGAAVLATGAAAGGAAAGRCAAGAAGVAGLAAAAAAGALRLTIVWSTICGLVLSALRCGSVGEITTPGSGAGLAACGAALVSGAVV